MLFGLENAQTMLIDIVELVVHVLFLHRQPDIKSQKQGK